MLFTYFRVSTSLSAIAVCALASIVAASAQTETILHTFTRPTGIYPTAGVITDGAGNLYGTAAQGGTFNGGVVYKLDPNGQYTVLHNFGQGADGSGPISGLVRDGNSNLYGTTEFGGIGDSGVVYKIDSSGRETVLLFFTFGPGGRSPFAGLTLDLAGNLYGTTLYGGGNTSGVVFRLDPSGQETVLYRFMDGADGYSPESGVILDPQGNLYGTTVFGGLKNAGTAYKLDTSGELTVLHTFTGGADGGAVRAGLIRDASGNLYGTTQGGGTSGVVFKLDASGNETVLHNFVGAPSDGNGPQSSLTADAQGNLYGTTETGGAFDVGSIFKIDAATHQESLVYNFNNTDGNLPFGTPLIVNGNIFGTTEYGGAAGYGVLFKITPAP